MTSFESIKIFDQKPLSIVARNVKPGSRNQKMALPPTTVHSHVKLHNDYCLAQRLTTQRLMYASNVNYLRLFLEKMLNYRTAKVHNDVNYGMTSVQEDIKLRNKVIP